MYESALKEALSLFKVPRSQQQFPYVPFVFGAYQLPRVPAQMMWMQHKSEDDCYKVYSFFVEHYLGRTTEVLAGIVHNSLLTKSEKSLIRLESAGVTVKSKPAKNKCSFFRVIAEREVYGKRLRYPELEIPDVQPNYPRLIYNSLTNQLLDVYFNIMGLSSNYDIELDIDPVTFITKKRAKQPLTEEEESQYKEFQQHLIDVGIITHQLLVASRANTSLVMLNKRGEEIDGETEPNVHILQFEKISTLRKSQFLYENFFLDQWMLVDIDFMQHAEGFS